MCPSLADKHIVLTLIFNYENIVKVIHYSTKATIASRNLNGDNLRKKLRL